VGGDGGGIEVSAGNVSVKACMTGSFKDGPTGGGFEITVSY
jgi:hypothetical protein